MGKMLPTPEGALLFKPISRFRVLAALLAATGWTGGQSATYNSRVAWIATEAGEELLANSGTERFSLLDVRDAAVTKDTACAANGPLIARRFGFDDASWANEIPVKRAALLVHPNSLVEKGLFVVRNALPELPLVPRQFSQIGACRRRWAKIFDIFGHRTEITDTSMELRCQRGGSFAQQLGYNHRVVRAIETFFASYDGRGVPAGLSGNDIPIEARLIRLGHEVSIHFDAAGKLGALRAIRRRRGSVLDPTVVDAFLRIQRRPGFWDLMGNQRLFFDWLEQLEAANGGVRIIEGYAAFRDATRLIRNAIDLKTPYTRCHSDRVGAYARDIARRYWPGDVPASQVVEIAGDTHDTGKIDTPQSVLYKPGPLTDDEWRVMQWHPIRGHEILELIPNFVVPKEVAYTHHANADLTSGSRSCPPIPKRYRRPGGQIPEARIVKIADVFDALVANRPYRERLMSVVEALAIMDQMTTAGELDAELMTLVRPLLPQWEPLIAESREPVAESA